MSKKLIYSICFVLALGSALPSVTTAELVGWWRLDEGSGTTANDSSGNGNHGTLQGDPQWVYGRVAKALQFDGVDDYVEVPHAEILTVDNEVTVMAWINAGRYNAANGEDWQGILAKGNAVRSYSFYTQASGALHFSTAGYGGLSTTQVPLNEWVHVCAMVVGGVHRYYVNGEPGGENGSGISLPGAADSESVLIGDTHEGTRDFLGMIDDARIYNHALTQQEIQEAMRGEGQPFAFSPNPADGAMYLQTWANLTWMPGDFAVSHDVYVGEDFDDVNEATRDSDTYRGNTTDAWFLVGFPGYPYPTGLLAGTTYYWRIDEVNDANEQSPWEGDVWSFFIPPKTAYDPDPADGAKFVDPNIDLSWSPGYGVAMHYVYFGDDYDTVKNATGGIPQAATTYDPGTMEFEKTYYWRVDEFDGATTHIGDVWSFTTVPDIPISDPNLVGWWKLDEGEGSITAVDWSGHGNHATLMGDPQWVAGYDGGALEFDGQDDYVTRGPVGITGAATRTIAGWAKLNRTIGLQAWTNVFGFSAVGGDDLHFDIEIVGGTGTTTAGYYGIHVYGWEQDIMPPDLEWHHFAASYDGTTISWYGDGMLVGSQSHPGLSTQGDIRMGKRIDTGGYFPGIVDNVRIYNRALTLEEIKETMRGDPLVAWAPSPGNGSTPDIEHVKPLSWQPGDKAAQHDVYFGTDETAVADADQTTPGIYRGRQGTLSYTPPEALQWGKSYYWRIDEYNSDMTISEGRIWSFTVAEYLIVEDFESYTDDIDNRIFQTWIDGWGYTEPEVVLGNGSGSTVGHLTPPFAEQTIVHSGGQSMPFDYNNIGTGGKFYYSETERTWDVAQDWTRETVKALTLYFRGYPPTFVEEPPGTYTMSADGNDIWGYADQFRYAVKRLSGDGTIEAQVLSVQNTDGWAKAGVMIRQSLDARSAFAAVYITPANGCRFQKRAATGGDATSDSDVTTLAHIQAPHWVKLERVGDTFNAYDSNDPAAEGWHPLAYNPQTIAMPSSVYIGLALTSHSAGVVCQAQFSDVATTGSVTGQWQVQDIGIEHPGNDVEQLYLAVEDSTGKVKVINHPDSKATTLDTWQEWNVDLRDITGVNLTAIKKMYLGVGDRDAPQRGGAGSLYFDDIRLCRPRCVASIIKPDADLSGNCVVDLADIEILSNEWLQSGAGLTADLYEDETVDLKDLAEIGKAWLEELLWPQP